MTGLILAAMLGASIGELPRQSVEQTALVYDFEKITKRNTDTLNGKSLTVRFRVGAIVSFSTSKTTWIECAGTDEFVRLIEIPKGMGFESFLSDPMKLRSATGTFRFSNRREFVIYKGRYSEHFVLRLVDAKIEK
jgi:hypothetical protein